MPFLRIRLSHPLYYLSALAVGIAMIAYGDNWRLTTRSMRGLGVGLSVAHVGWLVAFAGLTLALRRAAAKPRVARGAGYLLAATPPIVRWLTLGGFRKQMYVDAKARVIHLQQRMGWLWHGEMSVPFDRVSHVDYGYRSDGGSLERFSVALVLTDGTREHLFDFAGEVAEEDAACREESQSRYFVDSLTRMLGVGLSPRLDRVAA